MTRHHGPSLRWGILWILRSVVSVECLTCDIQIGHEEDKELVSIGETGYARHSTFSTRYILEIKLRLRNRTKVVDIDHQEREGFLRQVSTAKHLFYLRAENCLHSSKPGHEGAYCPVSVYLAISHFVFNPEFRRMTRWTWTSSTVFGW